MLSISTKKGLDPQNAETKSVLLLCDMAAEFRSNWVG